MTANEIQQELRAQARHLRTRSTPLNHIVPLMQRSADLIQEQQAEIEGLKRVMEDALSWVCVNDSEKPFTGMDLCGEMVSIRLTGLCVLARAIGKRNDDELMKDWLRKAQE